MCIRSDRIWPKGRMKIDTDGFWQRSWAVVVINRREMRHADDIEAGECFIEDVVAQGWGRCVYWRIDHGTGLAEVDLPCMTVYTNGLTVYLKLWVSLVCVTCITWSGTLIHSICRVCLYAWALESNSCITKQMNANRATCIGCYGKSRVCWALREDDVDSPDITPM